MASIGDTTRPEYIYDQATDTWIPVGIGPHAHTPAAIGAIASSIVTTKGDIIAATGSGLVVRQGVGADGSYLMADSSQADGLSYAGPSYTAGKNAIINGGMDIFQRTSFSTFNAYALDRWFILSSANAPTTQSTAKVTPNSQYMMLMTASATQQIFALQAIESKNAIYYAGKTVTLSAYAAGLTTTTNLNMALQYSTNVDEGVLGAGWAAATYVSGTPDLTLSSTVTRFNATYSIPSNAKSLRVQFVNNAANITAGQGIYLGDVQLELGSVATSFARNAPSIQGELAACQRYYWRTTGQSAAANDLATGWANSTTNAVAIIRFPVTMRTAATGNFSAATDFGFTWSAGTSSISGANIDRISSESMNLRLTTSGLTTGQGGVAILNTGTAKYLEASAEL